MVENIAGSWVPQNLRYAIVRHVKKVMFTNTCPAFSTQLFLNDNHKTSIAKFHREHSSFMGMGQKSQACLEIFGDVSEPVLDMIVVTFIYMETTRAKRSKEATNTAMETLGGF
jgi:hypothetical protein